MYGRTEILKKSKVSEKGADIVVESPCIHPDADDGGDMLWQYINYNYTVRPHADGRFSFQHCYANAKAVLREQRMFKPKELFKRDMFLMSYYYDRAVEAGLMKDGEDNKLLSVEDFKRQAEFGEFQLAIISRMISPSLPLAFYLWPSLSSSRFISLPLPSSPSAREHAMLSAKLQYSKA